MLIAIEIQEPVCYPVQSSEFRFQGFAFLFRVVLLGCGEAGLVLRFQLSRFLHQFGNRIPDCPFQKRKRNMMGGTPLLSGVG